MFVMMKMSANRDTAFLAIREDTKLQGFLSKIQEAMYDS